MPKVQTYETPEVQSRALRTPLQNLDSRGADFTALASGLSDVAGVMEQAQDEDDAAVVKERMTSQRNFSRNRLFSDEDAYYTRKGRVAYDSRGEIEKELRDNSKELSKGLSNRQSRLFKESVEQYLQRDSDGMARHSMGERTQWLGDQDRALVEAAQMDGAANPDESAIYSNQIKASFANLAKREGWPPEKTEVEVEKHLSSMHGSAVENMMLRKEFDKAGQYLDKNDGEIIESMASELKLKIDNEQETARHQALTEKHFLQFGMDEKAGKRYIRENYEGKEEDALVRRFNARVGETRERSRVKTNDVVMRSIEQVWGGEGIDGISQEDEDYLKSHGKWDLIGNEHIARSTGVIQHNDSAWLASNYYNLSVDEQLKVDVDTLKGHMDYTSFAMVMKSRNSMQEPSVTRSANDLIRTQLAGFGIDVNEDFDEDNKKRVDNYYAAYDKAVSQFVDEKDRQPNELEQQDLVKGVTATFDLLVAKGWIYDSLEKGPAYEVLTTENIIELSDELDIPAAEIPGVWDYLESRGGTINAKTLKEAYKAGTR